MTTNVTYHMTEKAEVLFMAAVKPRDNYKKTKKEYVVKIKLPENSPVIKHVMEINSAIVDTEANRLLEREGYKEKHISFRTDFPPIVTDDQNNRIFIINSVGEEEIILPDLYSKVLRFDGRIDKAEAKIVYKVIHYINTKLVRLQGIKILNFEQAPREEIKPMDDILDEIREFLK